MKFVKEGEKGKAICNSCGLTDITYLLRDVDFNDNSGTVKDILVGVCDKCHAIISIPAQSTAKIKKEYDKTRKSLEVRLPAHYLDILAFASQKIDKSLDESFYKALIIFYIHQLKEEKHSKEYFEHLLNSELAKAKSSKRLSFKLSERNQKEFNEIIFSNGIKNISELIKIVILKINDDIIRLNKKKEINTLRNFANIFY